MVLESMFGSFNGTIDDYYSMDSTFVWNLVGVHSQKSLNHS